MSFAHQSNRLLTGCTDKNIRIFDLNRADAGAEVMAGSACPVRCARWIQQDQLVVSSSSDERGLHLWDVRTGQKVQSLETESPITTIDVTFDGRYLTTAGGSTVRVWDSHSLQVVKSFDVKTPVEAASYSPDNGMVACGGEDMWVRLLDSSTGKEMQCNKGHHGPVHTVKFCPGGSFYASGSEDGTIRIWNVEGTAEVPALPA